jgi:hypothetical protein
MVRPINRCLSHGHWSHPKSGEMLPQPSGDASSSTAELQNWARSVNRPLWFESSATFRLPEPLQQEQVPIVARCLASGDLAMENHPAMFDQWRVTVGFSRVMLSWPKVVDLDSWKYWRWDFRVAVINYLFIGLASLWHFQPAICGFLFGIRCQMGWDFWSYGSPCSLFRSTWVLQPHDWPSTRSMINLWDGWLQTHQWPKKRVHESRIDFKILWKRHGNMVNR